MKKYLLYIAQRLGLWLVRKSGVVLIPRPREEIISVARKHVLFCQDKPNSWEWKHGQCIRALHNEFPKERIRTLNLAIEVALLECSA